jgi:NADH:ubiquinone oxidoreductase subunit F (NADH-binding)/NADH:ubiquinone oxidoreductase subunit E
MKSLIDRQVGTRIAKMLQDSQHEHGFIQESEIQRISNQVGEPVRVIQDVISFFPHFRRTKPPQCHVYVCRDMSCRLRGSMAISDRLRTLQSEIGSALLEITEASCLGRCDRAPAVLVNEDLFVSRTSDEIASIVATTLRDDAPEADRDIDTATVSLSYAEIDYYRRLEKPLYQAVKKYVLDPNPQRVINALRTAGLQGMGGAGAPASEKWNETRNAPGEVKYVVCNADESEPGTFKDRDILLAAPHLVIEGMIIAGLVTGAKRGFIYIRHEYFEQIQRLNEAIEEAVQLGACGQSIFGSTNEFRLEVFVSPGGYVCGEQTALIEALEGKRSEPRNRPPELQTNGLYDQPTILNNVETFAWVPAILLYEPTLEVAVATAAKPDEGKETGGVWYQNAGRNRTKGKRFFSISGDLNRPGAYEVPCGITLGELIDEYAGGMKDGCALQAVALSGPSGGFLPAWLPKGSIRTPKKLDKEGKPTEEWKYPQLVGESIDVRLLPLDLNAGREIGFMLGAGLVVYGEHADMLDQAIACSRFYQRESCGKCVPCRLGSRKMVDMAESLLKLHSDVDPAELENTVNILSRIMETTSICGLGQVASNPLKSYLKYFWRNTKSVKNSTP